MEEEIARERYRAEHGMKTHAERLAEMEAEGGRDVSPDCLGHAIPTQGQGSQNGTTWPIRDGSCPTVPGEDEGTLQDFLTSKEAPGVQDALLYGADGVGRR